MILLQVCGEVYEDECTTHTTEECGTTIEEVENLHIASAHCTLHPAPAPCSLQLHPAPCTLLQVCHTEHSRQCTTEYKEECETSHTTECSTQHKQVHRGNLSCLSPLVNPPP